MRAAGLGLAALLLAHAVAAQPLRAVELRDALVLPVELGTDEPTLRLRETSGLAWDTTRQRWWSVSDRGLLVQWVVSFDGGRLAARAAWAGRIEGRPNAESVDVLPPATPGTEPALAVLDEEGARWLRIDARGAPLGTTALPAHERADYTRGVEALAWHPRHGVIVVPQRPARGETARAHLLVAADGRAWTLPPAGDRASIKAAHVDAQGRLLLLEKIASAPLPGRWWLREVDLARCTAIACDAPPVALPVGSLADDDNLEGLACRDDGHCLLVSDDGRLAAPRTRLLWVALRR